MTFLGVKCRNFYGTDTILTCSVTIIIMRWPRVPWRINRLQIVAYLKAYATLSYAGLHLRLLHLEQKSATIPLKLLLQVPPSSARFDDISIVGPSARNCLSDHD